MGELHPDIPKVETRVESPDGTLAAEMTKEIISVYSKNIILVARFQHGHTQGKPSFVTFVVFHPDPKCLVRASAVLPNSQYIASGAADGSVALWVASQGAEKPIWYAPMKGANSAVVKLAFDGNKLLVHYLDKTVAKLNAETGEVIAGPAAPAPSDEGSKHLEDRIKIKGTKRPATEAERAAGGSRTSRYYMEVEIPTDTEEKVTRVTYFLNNPTFSNQLLEGKGEHFQVFYIGRSCLSTIIVTFTIEDVPGKSRTVQRDLNLCELVGDDRQ